MSLPNLGLHSVGTNTYYRFKLQIDAGTFKDVIVYTHSTYRSIADNSSMGMSAREPVEYGTLSAPNYRNVIISCLPPPGAYCSGGYVEARANGGYTLFGQNNADGPKS